MTKKPFHDYEVTSDGKLIGTVTAESDSGQPVKQNSNSL